MCVCVQSLGWEPNCERHLIDVLRTCGWRHDCPETYRGRVVARQAAALSTRYEDGVATNPLNQPADLHAAYGHKRRGMSTNEFLHCILLSHLGVAKGTRLTTRETCRRKSVMGEPSEVIFETFCTSTTSGFRSKRSKSPCIIAEVDADSSVKAPFQRNGVTLPGWSFQSTSPPWHERTRVQYPQTRSSRVCVATSARTTASRQQTTSESQSIRLVHTIINTRFEYIHFQTDLSKKSHEECSSAPQLSARTCPTCQRPNE